MSRRPQLRIATRGKSTVPINTAPINASVNTAAAGSPARVEQAPSIRPSAQRASFGRHRLAAICSRPLAAIPQATRIPTMRRRPARIPPIAPAASGSTSQPAPAKPAGQRRQPGQLRRQRSPSRSFKIHDRSPRAHDSSDRLDHDSDHHRHKLTGTATPRPPATGCSQRPRHKSTNPTADALVR